MIKDKKILIVGGSGSIGSELVRQLSTDNTIYILDFDETRTFDLVEELTQKGFLVSGRAGDIRDREILHTIFFDFKPQIIINAAALKHVTPSQMYPREYVLTNILGNLNLIEEAKLLESIEKFVFISTDKAVSEHKSVMGATKMCSEVITRVMGKGFIAVRFGNVMASRGSVLEIWARQFRDKEPLTITDPEMKRYFMNIPQAVKLVIKAIEQGEGGEVFILEMGKLKNILDLKNELYGKEYPTKLIGSRPGETLTERLMTSEEEKTAIKQDNLYIIK